MSTLRQRLSAALITSVLMTSVLIASSGVAGAAPSPSGSPGSGSGSGSEPSSPNSRPSGSNSSGSGSNTSGSSSAGRSGGGCARPSGIYAGTTPYPQTVLTPERVWPLSTGRGVTVAVVGSGIDSRNPQFTPGQVLPGVDLTASGTAQRDCDGRGTFAAGIVGAQRDSVTTFAGMAPDVRLFPVRYTQTTGSGDALGQPDALATAIDRAVSARCRVVLIAVAAGSDSARLRASVVAATRAGSVIITPAVAGKAGEASYPAADTDDASGVLAVGAVDRNGAGTQTETGGYIDVSAPGVDLVGTAPDTAGKLGHTYPVKDPTFAAAFVAGAAALLLGYYPTMTPAQVGDRLALTAHRPAGGRDDRRGWGTIDPYAAVTSVLPLDAGGPQASSSVLPQSVVPLAAPAGPQRPNRSPAVIALLGLLLAAAIVVAAATVNRGRRRGWRPGRPPEPTS